ncbi:MAG TPA: hypothetical protein PLT08_07685 [Anaerolineales bacterium]|nr:hypothetical protein [Anaerolineales bacterium]
MSTKEHDALVIKDMLSHAVGEKVWGVRLVAERAHRISIHFGSPTPVEGKSKTVRGKWRLLTEWCVWRLEKDGDPFVGSGDVPHLPLSDQDSQEYRNEIVAMQSEVQTQLERLNNLTLLAIEVFPLSFDVTFTFSEGIVLHLFSIVSKDDESVNRRARHWFFHLPNDEVLTVGPGTSWEVMKRSA